MPDYNILGYQPGFEKSERYSKVVQFVDLIADTKGLQKPISIFPDAYIKEWGFPSGIAIKASIDRGILFPAAVSDIGCGFRIIKTNIYKDSINLETAKRLADAVKEFGGQDSAYRMAAVSKLDADKIFCEGVEYLVEEGVGQKADLLKIQNYSSKQKAAPKLDFEYDDSILSNFAVYSDHFLEVRYVAELLDEKIASLFGLDLNQIIIIMHLGALPAKEAFLMNYYYPAAEYSFQNNLFSQHLIGKGIFGVPIDSEIGQKYLGAISALINYSYASRHMGSQLVLKAFKNVLGPQVEFTLVSDICHSKFEICDDFLFQLRGIQSIYPKGHKFAMPHYKETGDLALLAGQKGTSSYLVLPTDEIASIDYLCSHGTGDFKEQSSSCIKAPDWVKTELMQCYFDTGYDIKNELDVEYNSVNFSTKILVDDGGFLSLVARMAPFINCWTA